MPVGLPFVFPIELPEGPPAVSIPLNEILNAIVLLATGNTHSGGGPFPSGEGPIVTFEGDEASIDLGDAFDFAAWDGGDAAPAWDLPSFETEDDGGADLAPDDASTMADAFGFEFDTPLV